MRILDRVIRRAILTATLMVSAVMIGIQSFLSLVQQFTVVGQYHFGVLQAFLFVPIQLPAQFYQLFPIAGFMGALIGLTRLSSTSQLIVMRASGVSIVRIAWSVAKTAILMIIVVTAIGEGLAPQWQQYSEKIKEHELSPPTHAALLHSVWLHHGNDFTHIAQLHNNHTMLTVTRYHFDATGRLMDAAVAPSAHVIQGQWQLLNLKKTVFMSDRTIVSLEPHAALQVAFVPTLQLQMSIAFTEQTMMDLYRTIHYRQSIGLGINQYVFTFWQRLLQPMTTLVMICLAVPFVFGSSRSAAMGMRIFSGVVIGFAFYMLNQLLGPITLVYAFPPLYAAILPTCIFLGVGIVLLLRIR